MIVRMAMIAFFVVAFPMLVRMAMGGTVAMGSEESENGDKIAHLHIQEAPQCPQQKEEATLTAVFFCRKLGEAEMGAGGREMNEDAAPSPPPPPPAVSGGTGSSCSNTCA